MLIDTNSILFTSSIIKKKKQAGTVVAGIASVSDYRFLMQQTSTEDRWCIVLYMYVYGEMLRLYGRYKVDENCVTFGQFRYRPYVCQGPREKQPPERLINFGYVRLKCEVQASNLCPGV